MSGEAVSAPPVVRLERFYFGHLIGSDAHQSAPPGVIARTANCTPEQIAESTRIAKLAPPMPAEVSDDMPGALALFRGETSDFILAKAQPNDAGRPQILYILIPVAPLRYLAGNVLAFQSLAMMDMPAFSTVKQDLQPLDLSQCSPLSEADQTQSMSKLLLYCQDSFKTLEGILAGLVQGWPIAIVNAPASLEKRLWFVQGLLSLLPVPARIGITFATHVTDPALSKVQIKFISRMAQPDRHLIYDWKAGKLLTSPPEDSYSHYMVAQLRLDPSIAIAQTTELSRTTVWRAQHRDNLGNALAWVSRRAALDQAVREGLPADRQLVADILRQDPTLSDELRQVYARHMLAFALALGETDSVDIIPTVAVTNLEIAQSIAEQLRTAANNEQAKTVFTLLERWLLHIPETADLGWHPLLHTAARKHLSDLAEHNEGQQIVSFLNHIKNASVGLRFNEAMPQIVEAAHPPARTNPELARTLFLLAVETLPAGELHRLLSDKQFVQHLPRPTQTALLYLEPTPRHPAPPQVLDAGARDFGPGYRMRVLARLVEWAMYLRRSELVDTTALQSLLVMAQSPQADQFAPLIQHVVDDFSDISNLRVLAQPGPRILVQLLLQIGEFDQAIGMLEFFQNTLFGTENLPAFTQLAGDTFTLTPMAPEALNEALHYLEGSQIRPEPRVMVYCGALINRQWAADQAHAANRLTEMIFQDNVLIETLGHENAIHLLELHARARSAPKALQVGAALVDYTLRMGKEGAVLLMRMWPLLTWNMEMRDAAVELLRRFLRGAHLEELPTLIAYFEDELGSAIAESLKATYLLRQVIGGADLMQFANEVRVALELFRDIATTYRTDKEQPPLHRLRRDLDTMSGGLSDRDRQQVAENMLTITRLIYGIGRDSSRKRTRQATDLQLVQGQTSPDTGVELLRFVGGHFAKGQPVTLDLEREAMAHIFGNRSAAMLLHETTAITRLLTSLETAFPQTSPPLIASGALKTELDSLWRLLSLHHQRQIEENLSHGCQQLADVISLIANDVKDRVLSDSGIGHQLETGQRQPQKPLEAMRWIYGYFARKHIRMRT